MGYFENLLRAVAGKPNAERSVSNSRDLDAFLRGGEGRVSEKQALKVAAAWRCVQLISSAIATMPVDLIERVDERTRRPAEGHPFRDVLTVRPNSRQTPKQFIQQMMLSLLLRGNSYALKVRQGDSIEALLPIEADKVTPELRGNRVIYKVQQAQGAEIEYGADQILHLVGMSLDGVSGLTPIEYMSTALGISLDAEKASGRILNKGTLAGGKLRHPAQLSTEAFERLKASFETAYSGAQNAGKTIILEEGADFEPLAMSAQDMQFLESRDFQRADIAMFYGVPPHMIGATSKTTSWGSGIEQQSIGFVTYTLRDWMVSLQQTIKRDCLAASEWDRYDVRFFPQALLQGDSKAQWNAFVQGRQWGIYSPNDVRAMLDMNPRLDPGGDEYAVPPNETTRPDQTPEQADDIA